MVRRCLVRRRIGAWHGLKLGDTLTVNLLGREITATIASLRQIDWARLGINFAIVFAPAP
jgi:putative ABC transport system permease protein